MTKYPNLTKEEINLLPLYTYNGKIILIEDLQSAITAAKDLCNESLLGFDTETRASFKKGEHYNVALVQLATKEKAYIFRINKFKIPDELILIFSDPKIIKAGVGIRDDVLGLKKIYPFKDNGFIDLAEIAKENKIKQFGLRSLTAILLNKRLSKNAKITNWEKDILTPAQIKYAACDAVVGYEIYLKFLRHH